MIVPNTDGGNQRGAADAEQHAPEDQPLERVRGPERPGADGGDRELAGEHGARAPGVEQAAERDHRQRGREEQRAAHHAERLDRQAELA
ncbi:MAG TPA: hypothetical protein PKC20_20930, partial [Burkholderiaceae bacterium]|nr:hypothetical protein [Burkholderiaceae bacterium]